MVGPARTRVLSAVAAAGRLRAAGSVAALASVVAMAWPGEARSAEPSAESSVRGDARRPWGRGVMRPTFGLSPWGLFNPDVASLSFGVGFNYFIVNGLSVGLGVSDTIFIYRSAFKAQYPGIETNLPTNMLEVTPTLQYVFFRSRRFSPFVYGGAGPVFFNHGGGTYGQWVAGPGVYFNVAGPLFVSAGVGFSGLFPSGRCNDALTYQPADAMGAPVRLDLCSFRWGPQLGMALAFGGGGKRERRQPRPERREPPRSYEPASNPLDQAVGSEPPPGAVPVGPPQPEPDATEPDATEPEATEPEAAPPEATDVALPPDEPPPVGPPEGTPPVPEAAPPEAAPPG